ncbi:MAG: DUF2911 domain-containing protein [Bryobacterales bacterium]|nr:DUF2911 domain-containing protein [Bryobacterales bacterium]MBV9399818.1 DUF2911 domain-containing protein [Bryobacterales bacterium]
MNMFGKYLALLALAPACGFAQVSPAAQADITVAGKKLVIRYAAPSVRGRKIFGEGGLLSRDPTYPAWRAGANSATSFHTDADLDVGGLSVPKGDYTLYCWVKDPNAWELIISKETGQWGLEYNPKMDLGRAKMTMSTPSAKVETLKYTFTSQGGNKVKLDLAWENHAGSVMIAVK